MRRFVLGTAGHVDHGKTTLVRALTGIDTDRLPEEKRRGITIELGFAPWDLGGGFVVSLIDVPGHRKLVHAMIAGATGMELVLLVVAADEGVMPQTREHVAACELLGIRRAVVAVTKLDRVGAELAQLAGEEARELLGDRFDAEVVTCSARTGEGIPAVREAVRRALSKLGPPKPGARARLSVDRVFSVRGAGTVVTGTLVEGKIALAAPLFVVREVAGVSSAIETQARGLHVHDHAVDLAEAPTRLAVNLAGVPLDGVRRGDVVTSDRRVGATRRIDVALRLGETDTPVRSGASAMVYVGTARSSARIELLGDAGTEPPASLARLRLAHAIVVLGGDRFVLRGSDVEGPAGAVLGGGTVLDAGPPARTTGARTRAREKRKTTLEALAAGDAAAAVRGLVEEAAPGPLSRDTFAVRFPLAAAALLRAAESLAGKGEIAAIKGQGWASPASLATLAAEAMRLVGEHHRAAPLDRGLPLETLRKKLGERAGPEVAEEAIRIAREPPAAGKRGAATEAAASIVIEGDVARLAAFGGAPVGGAAAGALGKAAVALGQAGLKGVTEFAVKEATDASPKEVKAILAKLVRENAAVHSGELWFARAAYDELKTRVVEVLASKGRLTIAEFKEMSGLGRKQAIVLLEQLDRDGVTRRDGDDRVPHG